MEKWCKQWTSLLLFLFTRCLLVFLKNNWTQYCFLEISYTIFILLLWWSMHRENYKTSVLILRKKLVDFLKWNKLIKKNISYFYQKNKIFIFLRAFSCLASFFLRIIHFKYSHLINNEFYSLKASHSLLFWFV